MIEQTVDIPRPMTARWKQSSFIPNAAVLIPPVLLLMDAPGIRQELHDMASRLATVGYFVLLPNLYYRAGRDTKYGPDVLERRQRRAPADARCALQDDHSAGDARMSARCSAFIDGSGRRRRPAPVGAHGYCMSGPYALAAAARYPDRDCRRGLVLRHVAGQRRGRKPASELWEKPRASCTSPAPNTMNWRRCRWSRNCAMLFVQFGCLWASWSFIATVHHGFGFPQRWCYDRAGGGAALGTLAHCVVSPPPRLIGRRDFAHQRRVDQGDES